MQLDLVYRKGYIKVILEKYIFWGGMGEENHQFNFITKDIQFYLGKNDGRYSMVMFL